ncbi:hypothetical protein [Streptomyces sp. NPDC058644]|uniref:hypothetical protein n=1 Tax=unclassified Streptomyces TaxID=2593676 RepID=UPI0036592027
MQEILGANYTQDRAQEGNEYPFASTRKAFRRARTRLIDNGDFDFCWRHHTAREHQRLYPAPDQQEYGLTA